MRWLRGMENRQDELRPGRRRIEGCVFVVVARERMREIGA